MIDGGRIEQRMKEMGLTQAELARRAGVSQPTIFKLIRENKTGSRVLHKVARVLQTTPAHLTGETDDPDGDGPDEPTLTSDEAELLELFRAIEPKERAAFMVLVRSIATNARSPTVNEKGLSYRGPGAAKR